MPSQLRAFFSHRVETLYNQLRQQLFNPASHPMARRLVILPSPAMKTWLCLKMAQDPTCGIAAGMEIGYVDQTIRKLVRKIDPLQGRDASKAELALLIEEQLYQAIGSAQQLWVPVRQFIGGERSLRAQRRTTALAWQLARLFETYGLYGGDALQRWEDSPTTWQEELWQRVWRKATALSYPYRSVGKALDADCKPLVASHTEVHLFAISFLPALTHRFLMHLSSEIPVNYYVLSPCQAFWSDIKSDRETRRLHFYWKRKGAPQRQLDELDTFLRDRNPLLANFGRLGREMAEQLEAGDGVSEEEYSIPEKIAALPPYEELLDGSVALRQADEPPVLLDYIQADLTLLRNPYQEAKIDIAAGDLSVQVHACPSRRREVENIYNVIMGIIDRHKGEAQPIAPGDIIVMAPDLMEYAPHIRAVFGSGGSALDYQLMEVDLLMHSAITQAFGQLLALAAGRWDAASLIEFFELAPVRRRLRLKGEDVRKLRDWVLQAGIRWGEDASDRNEILRRSHCASGLVDGNPQGTWERGFDRLLSGLAFTADYTGREHRFAPLEAVENTNAELLGRFMEILRGLKKDLQPLHDGTAMTMELWGAYLKALMDAYLQVDRSDKEEADNKEALDGELNKLAAAGRHVPEHVLSYSSVKLYLDQALQGRRVNYREGHLQAVRFCSMLPMRALPAKAVIMMGMNDGAFPKGDNASGLDMLRDEPCADYMPLPGDFDRSLFLEALLSARRYFVLSYCTRHEGREETPSILVGELLAYIEAAYSLQGPLHHRHACHGFDACYFKEGYPFRSYSQRAFKAACAYYRMSKIRPHAFVADFSRKAEELVSKGGVVPCVVDIRDLKKMAKDPIQAYFNHTLGIYLDDASKQVIESDELFDLTHLDLHHLKEELLIHEMETVLARAEAAGALPSGLFKEMAHRRALENLSSIEDTLRKKGIDKADIVDIRFSTCCDEPIYTEGRWECPPVEVKGGNGQSYLIVGTLPNVTAEGMLAVQKKDPARIQQFWPLCLVLHAAIQQYSLPVQARLIFLIDGAVVAFDGMDMTEELRAFLHYYKEGMRQPSPLLKEWTKAALDEDAAKFAAAVDGSLGSGEGGFYSDYAKWVFNPKPDAAAIATHWNEAARNVYGRLYGAIASKKNKGEGNESV